MTTFIHVNRKHIMRHPLLNSLVLVVLSVSAGGAGAQQIYRCGDSYSQTPCPDGVVIDATDGRTKVQRTQADLATKRAERTAAAMEKARLQQEKTPTAAHAPKVKAKASAPASKNRNSQARKKKESEYFTVQIPGKKAAKKSTAKQEGN